MDHAGIGSTPGDPVALVSSKWGASERTHVPDGAGYVYKLKANLDCKVDSRTFGRVSDLFHSDDTSSPGWLSYNKGDILQTEGVPIKGKGKPLRINGLRCTPSFHCLSDPYSGSYDGFHATNAATQASGCAYTNLSITLNCT